MTTLADHLKRLASLTSKLSQLDALLRDGNTVVSVCVKYADQEKPGGSLSDYWIDAKEAKNTLRPIIEAEREKFRKAFRDEYNATLLWIEDHRVEQLGVVEEVVQKNQWFNKEEPAAGEAVRRIRRKDVNG